MRIKQFRQSKKFSLTKPYSTSNCILSSEITVAISLICENPEFCGVFLVVKITNLWVLTTCQAGFTYISLYNLPKAYKVDATAISPFYKRGKKLRQVLGGGGRPENLPRDTRKQNQNLNLRESGFSISQSTSQCPAVSQYTYLHISEKYTHYSLLKRDFVPVAKIPCSQYRGPDLISGQTDLHATAKTCPAKQINKVF